MTAHEHLGKLVETHRGPLVREFQPDLGDTYRTLTKNLTRIAAENQDGQILALAEGSLKAAREFPRGLEAAFREPRGTAVLVLRRDPREVLRQGAVGVPKVGLEFPDQRTAVRLDELAEVLVGGIGSPPRFSLEARIWLSWRETRTWAAVRSWETHQRGEKGSAAAL